MNGYVHAMEHYSTIRSNKQIKNTNLCWVSEAWQKIVYTIWFNLNKILEQAKLNSSDRNQIGSFLGQGVGKINQRAQGKFLDWSGGYTVIDIPQKSFIYRLKHVNFIFCKL